MKEKKVICTNDKENKHKEMEIRKLKLYKMKKKGFNFPNHFKPNNTIKNIKKKYKKLTKEIIKELAIFVHLAGRIIFKRIMGKASFFTIQDASYNIQIYLKKNILLHDNYEEHIYNLDIGDFIGIQGQLFKTKTDELTVRCTHLILLNKSIHPLPDKFHGLINKEIKYRKRYIDLISSATQFRIFEKRFKIIELIRKFMIKNKFLEVETPMLHNIPGGANARPFTTHHNNLNSKMYLRISPELYLKKLIIGGFNKIFEMNRNFRNEGVSSKHNPEFTMIEIYQTYTSYKDMMILIEKLFKYVTLKVLKNNIITFNNNNFDISKNFEVLTMKNAIIKFNSQITLQDLTNYVTLTNILNRFEIKVKKEWTLEKIQSKLFEVDTEKKIINPTFITEYPIDISPLARKSDSNNHLTDRFELFIGGMEIANGFSELNDYEDQKKRFESQLKIKNFKDENAKFFYDQEYITALEYGLPPTSGLGIGIDRFVMLLTNKINIRDVILFPTLKKSE
ncbi:Lysine--tRNA ligase [Buchnera aphidicola (Thelaxes suberi)]|uniref:lysine--tRNA ligase n=1 Tax=Buchnera aphidicola TaxID=9 RepID=UPI003464877A